MKKLLIIPTLFITLFSCSKSEVISLADPQLSVNGSIEYKVNGNLVIMENVDFLNLQYAFLYKQILNTNTFYRLNAQKGVNNFIAFNLDTDSLHEINYHHDSTGVLNFDLNVFNGQQSGLFFVGDFLDINITSHKNSRMSATFTAKFSPMSTNSGLDYSKRGTILITEGKINNVQVIY